MLNIAVNSWVNSMFVDMKAYSCGDLWECVKSIFYFEPAHLLTNCMKFFKHVVGLKQHISLYLGIIRICGNVRRLVLGVTCKDVSCAET